MIAGVDGTSQGWIVVLCGLDLRGLRGLFIQQLRDLPRDVEIAAVDVPIGLPGRAHREADLLARKSLGEPRRRSVFPCPLRATLGARSWEEACERTEQIDGRRVSRQTFGILRKIEEADEFVRSDAWACRTIYEVHPELSFAKWSGAPMVYGKKSPAGRDERCRLIAATFGPDAFATVRQSVRGNQVGSDDVMDAFAAVWTASRIRAGTAEPFPVDRVLDTENVPMQMWA